MSYTPPGSANARASDVPYGYDPDDTHGQGLVTFAGVMLTIAATLNTLYGIAAIDRAQFFVNDARYVFSDLRTLGWFVLALGVAQYFAAFGIWRGTSWARWFGVACASVNSVLQMAWIPAKPVLAMTILALDIAVIYGLCAYGGRRKSALAQERREEAARYQQAEA